jgi:hypothetical protein
MYNRCLFAICVLELLQKHQQSGPEMRPSSPHKKDDGGSSSRVLPSTPVEMDAHRTAQLNLVRSRLRGRGFGAKSCPGVHRSHCHIRRSRSSCRLGVAQPELLCHPPAARRGRLHCATRPCGAGAARHKACRWSWAAGPGAVLSELDRDIGLRLERNVNK